MHPALIQRIDLIKRKKLLQTELDANLAAVQAAIDAGEIKLENDRYQEGGLYINVVERTNYKFSPAVDALREQEIFEQIATAQKTASLRFVYKDE
jgi:lipopolysaccharide biosynthesis regulator YciM